MTLTEHETARIQIIPKTLVQILGLVALVWALLIVYPILFLFLFACVVASAMYPAVCWANKKRLPKVLVILLFYLGLFLLLLTGIVLLGYVLTEQIQIFARDFPHYVDSAISYLDALPLVSFDRSMLVNLSQGIHRLMFESSTMMNTVIQYVGSIFGWIAKLLIIMVFTFYLLNDPAYFKRCVLRLFPTERQPEMSRILDNAAYKTGAYIRGQLIAMTTMGVLVWIGLSLIGVPHANVLGFIYFLVDLIPFIGPAIAISTSMLAALSQDPLYALWTLLYMVALISVENYVLIPNIVSRSVDIHPFWVLFSIMIAGSLFGFMGVLLAVPATVFIGIILDQYYLKPLSSQVNLDEGEGNLTPN